MTVTVSGRQVDVLLEAARVAHLEGRFAEASERAREAAAAAFEIGDTHRRASAGYLLATGLLRGSGPEAALGAAKDALELAGAVVDRRLRCQLLILQGLAYSLLGLSAEAFEALDDARSLAEDLAEPELLFWVWARTAGIHAEIGEYDRGRILLDHATRWLPGLGDEAHAVAHNNLTLNAWFEGRRLLREGQDPSLVVRSALGHGQQAVEIGRGADNPFIEGTAVMNLAMLHACIGDLGRALEGLDASLLISSGGRYPALEMSAQMCRAEVMLMAGDPTEAVVLADRALTTAVEIGESKAAMELEELRSLALQRLGRFEEALDAYKRFHEHEKAIRTEVATTRARVLAWEIDLENSREEARAALAQSEAHWAHNQELEAHNHALTLHARQLEAHSNIDALTGLVNRRLMESELPALFERATRGGYDLCLALIDIDHFKTVNDTFGHSCGDRVLTRVASLLRDASRTDDLVGRLGGEEFVIAYPGLAVPEVLRICERLRRGIAAADWSWLAPDARVTISIGLQALTGCDDVWQQLDRADAAMYRAKAQGRNAVAVGSEEAVSHYRG